MKVSGLQMGLTIAEVGLMYMGAFKDMFEEYKKWHNIRTKKQLFALETFEEVASLDDL